jgi:putative hydrolase of the HAD superfamily
MKAVIFDLDNTLIDFVRMKHKAIDGSIRAMRKAGLKKSAPSAKRAIDILYKVHGMEYRTVFQAFLRQSYGRVDDRLLASAIVGYRKAEALAMRPYPQVKGVLSTLQRRGMKIGICTDAPRLRAWMRLVELGLDDTFDAVVTFEDTHHHKPDPAPFRLVLRKLGVTAKDALMVGDSLDKDVAGAHALGMKTCFARYGNTGPKTGVRPDYVISRIGELGKILR